MVLTVNMLPSTADLRNTTFSPRHTVLTVAHSQMQLADFLAAFCGFSNLSFIVCSMGACQWVNDTSGPLLPSSPRRAYLNPCAIKAGLSATFNIASQRGRDVAVLHTIICFIAITFRIICMYHSLCQLWSDGFARIFSCVAARTVSGTKVASARMGLLCYCQ